MGMRTNIQTGEVEFFEDIPFVETEIEQPIENQITEQPILSLEELTTVVLDLQQQVEILGGTN